MNKVSKTTSKKELLDQVDTKVKSRKKRSKKEKSDVKRAKTAYIFFTCDQVMRKKVADVCLVPKEVMGKLAELWQSLNDKEKKPYVDLAEQDKKRHSEEVNEHKIKSNLKKNGNLDESNTKKKKKLVKKVKSIKNHVE